MKKYKSEGIKERTNLIYELGLENDYHNIKEDKETVAIRKLMEVINFYKSNGFIPRRSSESISETQLAGWIQRTALAYRGKGDPYTKFYPALLEILTQHNLPNIFELRYGEDAAIKKLMTVIEFMHKYNKIPLLNSTDKNEADMAKWIVSVRSRKKRGGLYYNSFDKITHDMGIPDLFNINKKNENQLNKCMELIQFVKSNGTVPNQDASIKEIRSLASWMYAMKQFKIKNGGLPPYIQKLIEFHELHNLFDPVDWKSDNIDSCNKIINFYALHKKLPSSKGKHKFEKQLAAWIQTMKKSKIQYPDKFDATLILMATNAGIPNLFEYVDHKQNAIDTLYKLIDYVKNNNKYPVRKTEPSKEIRSLQSWIAHMRNTKAGDTHRTWYPELDQIAIEQGLPNMFNSNWKDDLK